MLNPQHFVLTAAFFLAACSDSTEDLTSPTPEAPAASASRGRATFVAECASCHASGDGADLALFQFPDSTIVRRALGHVPMDQALDIVAHVRSLAPGDFDRRTRVFQPGGRVLADDRAFAALLFGSDAFPNLGTMELRAIDPRAVPVALALPRWSVEEENLDWMPDAPIEQELLGFRGAGEAVAAYHRARTTESLLRAVALLRGATRSADMGAPCALVDEVPADPERCFQAQRWIASLGAQHMLRTGSEAGLHRSVHDSFWDVGQTVRRSLVRGGVDVGNAEENWATWMLLGWMFEPGEHASVYTGNGLLRMGLPRHATFVALRSMVARPQGSPQPYQDVANAARFAPAHWARAVTRTGLVHLEERLLAGEVPRLTMETTMADLRADVESAYRTALRKDAVAAEALGPLRERVLALMPPA